MKSVDRILVLLTAGLLLPGMTHAAALATESFTAGLNGWTNGNDATKWTASAQAVRVSFGVSLVSQNAALEAGPGASAGTFSGHYSAANIEAIGFSFLAENFQPSVLKLEITGGTNVIFQDLVPRLTTVGNWNYILCPLIGPGSTRWSGAPLTELPNILTNVSRLALRIATGINRAEAYRLDDIFLDLLPVATALAAFTTNTTAVTFNNLRTNFAYRIQTIPALTATWTNAVQLTATNRTQTITVTNPVPSFYYRLEN